MKIKWPNRNNGALTMIEVLVIVFGLFVVCFFLLLFSQPCHAGRKARTIQCTYNLKQIGIAARNFASEHNGKFPMEISVQDGGTKDVANFGIVTPHFLVMAYDLATPKVLHCPFDERPVATNFTELRDINLSYFVGLDSRSNAPPTLFSGDRNVTNEGAEDSRILELTTNQPVAWTGALHGRTGNVLLSDGSVQGLTSFTLRGLLRDTGLATNRIAVP
ncbi:MAG TPA: DUF1559 domain-containing protein [Candidatus Eisenbacteria bacterium]|jgi:hypothetical protein|nr:DUF1559 domain-containing protein [Candidatus Eisenbacteria bacterium]